jgi:hypothetical protein
MALTAVTGLKITKITRAIFTPIPPASARPTNSVIPFKSFVPGALLEASMFEAVCYTFEIEWTNPNADPHWTELTITESGQVRQITNAYVQGILSTLPATLTEAQIPLVKAGFDKIYLGTTAGTASMTRTWASNEQSTEFRGLAKNTTRRLGCAFYKYDGEYARTVTIKVAIKDLTQNKEATITQTITLDGTVSELKGPTLPTLNPNGTISVRYSDPFIVTESDSGSASTTLLGVGASLPRSMPHPLYSADIARSDVIRSGMELSKFYKVASTLNYGVGIDMPTTTGIGAAPLSSGWPDYLSELLRAFKSVASSAEWEAAVRMMYFRVTSNTLYYGPYYLFSPYRESPVRFSGIKGTVSTDIDLQYIVISPPTITVPTGAAVRAVTGQSFTYQLVSEGATSFSLGTLPANVTASIDSNGLITGTMSAVGTFTVPVNATNIAGTTSASLQFVCSAFVGNDTSIQVDAGQPISVALTASQPATFEIVTAPAEASQLSIIEGKLTGIIHTLGSYSISLRARLIGSTTVTDLFTVSVSVSGLNAPRSVEVVQVQRVLSPDKTTVSYYGTVQWFNQETTRQHTVLVECTDSETGATLSTNLPRNSVKTNQILLGTWLASTELTEKVFKIKVTIVGQYSSVFAVLDYSVSFSQVGTLYGDLGYDGVGNLTLPAVDIIDSPSQGTVNAALSFSPASTDTPPISVESPSGWRLASGAPLYSVDRVLSKSLLQFLTSQQVYGLRDGGTYLAEAEYPLAGALTTTESLGRKIWQIQPNSKKTSVVFEYYYRGQQVPVITSALSLVSDVGSTFQYQIQALGAKSFSAVFTGLSGFFVNPTTGLLEGVFTSDGVKTILISATNAKGTTTQTLTVTVRDFYAEAISIRATVNKYIREKLVASRPATWSIVSGAPAGLSIIVDSLGAAFLVGSVAATGSYSVVLRATQKDYSPVRSVDVTYPVTILSSDVVDPSDVPTVIVTPSNLSLYDSEKPLFVGDRVKLAFKSNPPFAVWAADGLPPGLKINAETGEVSGVVRTAGSYVAQITATSAGRAESLPLVIAFEVDPTTTDKLQAKAAGEAINRLPWLVSKWDLIDLQILARSRVVQSSLSTTADDGVTSLKFKIGDDLKFGVFFIDGDNMAFAINPSRVRLTIRPINNVDDPLILETVESPSVTIEEDTPYYELTSVRGVDWNAESMSIVEDWVLAQQAASSASAVSKLVAPLACVAEVEWIKEGKSYSSESFPVSLELDVNR